MTRSHLAHSSRSTITAAAACRWRLGFALLTLLMVPALFAQAPAEVLYKDDFQAYGTQVNPPGWVDRSVGSPSSTPEGLYKTWPDPTQGNKAPNIVYGTKSASGKPEGRNPRIGTFSTLTTKEFDAKGRFEFSGRLIRTRDDGRVGISVLSQYPASDKYYLLGLWSQAASSKLTMQLFAFDKTLEDPANPLGDQSARLEGTRDSGVTLEPNKWYRFLLRADDRNGKTNIQAKVWLDGTAEPATWTIDASDASEKRLTKGHIGLWSAVRGENYIDEILAKSPVDFTAPQIAFFHATEAGEVALPPGFQTNKDLTPIIRVTDDIDPNPSFTATLDGALYTPGTPVTTEGNHTLEVYAFDSVGNDDTKRISFFLDKTPPTVIVREGTTATLAEDALFADAISINLGITDASGTTVEATLNGEPFTPGTPLLPAPLYGVEKHQHALLVTVRDDVGNVTPLPALHFTIDRAAPVVTITKDDVRFSGGAFNVEVALEGTVDDLTPAPLVMVLRDANGDAPYTPDTLITADGTYTITAKATDLVGHETIVGPFTFVINQSGPGIAFLDGDVPLQADTFYKRAVPARIAVTNLLPPTVTATLDDVAWPLTLENTTGTTRTYAGPVITTEGRHTLVVRVTDDAGNDVTAPIAFTIDTTPPTIAILEGEAAFPRPNHVFDRDVTATVRVDDAITTPKATMTLDDVPYSDGTTITAEGVHTIAATAVDEAGNTASDGPFRFTIDKSDPVVTLLEGTDPFPPDSWFSRPVQPGIEIHDLTPVTVEVLVDSATTTFTQSATDGTTSIWTGTAISAEGPHTIAVTVTDSVGRVTPLDPVSFTIDTTPPAIDVTSHTEGQVVTAPSVVLAGASDDAVSVTVNGTAATVTTASKTWTTGELSLLEGETTFIVVGTDRAGNNSQPITRTIHLDTRGPALAVTTPPSGTCVNTAALTVQGTASDARLASVKARVGSTPYDVTLTGGTWSVTIPTVADGPIGVVIEAADAAGHTATTTASYRIDRTKPVIEIHEGGAPFAATLVNRVVALFVRATDADPSVHLTMTLDGAPYVSGAPIEAETTHTLVAAARDCAGNPETRTLTFRIDKTAPTLTNLAPANGATTGTMPSAITGASEDATKVEIVGSALAATPTTGSFTLGGVPFEEGTNRFTLRATDEAGNARDLAYVVTIKTVAPTVEITEGGTPIAANALFNRAITPEIRASDADATLTATLNDAPYTPGTAITTDGTYKLTATATDALHNAGSKTATFRIDTSGPVVTITTPAQAAVLQADTTTVTGTATGATSVTVNGAAAALSGESFTATVPLELGENSIVAVGRDAAGNTGRADVTVTRGGAGPAIVLVYPTDKSLTNRPKTEVLGRVITPASVASVTVLVGGQTKATVTPDAAGDFRTTLDLVEGLNAISATSTGKDGKTATATVQVTADFTPPTLRILAAGQELREGARFAAATELTLEASDAGTPNPTLQFTLNGTALSLPTTAPLGGHVAIAMARDAAGNEARVERSFTIGTGGGGSSSCSITNLDPDERDRIVASSVTRIAGRTNAEAVRVAGTVTEVVAGAFCTDVQLPNEGENPIEIVCLSGGETVGDPVTMTLIRATGLPTVAIDSPTQGQVLTEDRLTVTGTVGPGVTSVSVNGKAAAFSSTDTTTTRTFTAADVIVAHGQNLLAARATTATGRMTATTRRVSGAIRPAVLTISSPLGTIPTGAASIDVSGTWMDLDPATLTASSAAGAGSPAVVTLSDTDGTFVVREVPLAVGENTITVRGRDAANLEKTAEVTVTRTAGAPSVRIDSPADNAQFPTSTETITVTGVFTAAEGARVEISGVPATVSGTSFTASVPLLSNFGAPTPILARLTEPSGNVAFTTARVTRLIGAFEVQKSDKGDLLVFPADGTVQVPVSAQILVLLTHTVDRASVAGSILVETASGQPVAGTLAVDQNVVAFAPNAPLADGASYTIRVKPTLADVAGTTLASEVVTHFLTEFGAPNAAPVLDPLPGSVCGDELTVSGTTIANARVRIDLGGAHYAPTDATGRFTLTMPVAGPSGARLLRVRSIGTGGALSPAAEACIAFVCETGPSVMSATYDDTANALAIVFSAPIDPVTLGVGSSITLVTSDQRSIGGTVTLSGLTATVRPSENLAESVFTLTVTTAVKDLSGRALTAPFVQTFVPGGSTGTPAAGWGYVTGEVYDATNGRPLVGASVRLAAITAATDARGRYTVFVPEGAHTIEVSAANHTSVWRQIIVPVGAGVIPIDIRLETRGETKVASSGELTLAHGGVEDATTPVTLTVTAGSLTTGSSVTLTSVNAQSLAGLLPLGWSPLASAEVVATGTTGATVPVTGTLAFTVTPADITNASQSLTAIRYDTVRDEWIVVDAAATIIGTTATVTITRDGAYALVYPDKAPLAPPPAPSTGLPLAGVADPCAVPGACGALTKESFELNPTTVMPDQRTIATLRVTAVAAASAFPSGTAVQAAIDEELHLADGTVLTDAPFAADLLLYRTLGGETGVAAFHLAPSKRATEVFLEVGWEHITISAYPGRLDRGTLIGTEGGRVPGDGSVAIDIPEGATPEPLHATVRTLDANELPVVDSINGYTVLGGFELTMDRVSLGATQDLDDDGTSDTLAEPLLFKAARATFGVDAAAITATSQVILAEVADAAPYGTVYRLVNRAERLDAQAKASKRGIAQTTAVTTSVRFSTSTITPELPLDGIVHGARYLILAAKEPVAYATGLVRLGSATGPVVGGGRVRAQAQASGAQPLGVADVTRVAGIYNVPVPAEAYLLRAEHASTGEGVPYAAPGPTANAVEHVTLVLAPQPATITAVRVFKANLAAVDLTTTSGTDIAVTSDIIIDVSKSLDPTSITNESIIVATTSGARVPGVVSLNGQSLTWTTATGDGEKLRLAPNTRYVVTVSATIRASNGTPMGETRTYGFATVQEYLGGGIRRDKIRITIPTPDGVSTIAGEGSADPNERAVPSNAVVVAVRRTRAFTTLYQAEADITGAFRFDIGSDGGTDKVSIRDVIDLHVVNSAGILMGVVRLGPFADPNGLGFVPPVGEASTYTTAENVTITVPAGAFTEPAIVTAKVAGDTAFRTVADVASELTFGTGLTVSLQCGDARTPCEAKVPLELELPVPAGTDTARAWYLGAVGASAMGPRVMLVDTLRIDGGKFKTAAESTGAKTASRTLNATTGGWLDFGAKGCLLRTTRSSEYVGVSLTMGGGSLSLGAAFFSSADTALELTNSQFKSLYLADYYFGSGRDCAAFPVIQGQAFTMTGIDRRTGLVASERVYDAIPVGGGPYQAGSPEENRTGPYPIWTSPGRIEVVPLQVVDVEDESVRGLKVELSSKEIATVSRTSLPAGLRLSILNVNRGVYKSVLSEALPVTLPGKLGDLLVIAIEQQEVDPFSDITVVFNEPIAMDGDPQDILPGLIKVEVAEGAGASPTFTDITGSIAFDTDSFGRRIVLRAPGSLPRGALVRLTLSKDIADASEPALKLGQYKYGTTVAGGGSEQYLWFRVRAPKGELSSFDLPAGAIRMLSLFGNTLFVAAMDSGTLAYDVANPAALLGTEAPYAHACGTSQDWTVKADHHGRIYTTGINSGTFGFLRSYRMEDFLAKKGTPSTGCDDASRVVPRAGTIVSWAPGATSLTLGLTAESNRAEAVPRRMEVLHQDVEEPLLPREEFLSGYTVSNLTTQGEAKRFDVSIPWFGTPYALQRVTIENVSSKMRWSGDAKAGTPAVIQGVVAGPFDKLRVVRNRSTWGVVSLFGFGVGIYDLNAIESNDSGAATRSEEQIALLKVHSGQCTAGLRWRNDYDVTQENPAVIHDTRFSPEISVRSSENKLFLYAIDRIKGVLDLHTTSAITSSIFDCDLATGTRDARYGRAPEGLVLAHREAAGLVIDNPRLATLKTLYPGGAPQLNFVGSVVYPANGTTYNLVAARDYGLLVVETGREDEEPWRVHDDLAAIIWIPSGAYGVRLVPGAAMASVVDGDGRLLLVDLSTVDERALVSTSDELFPTTKAALLGSGSYGIGAPDSRILWSSEPGLFTGTVPPVIDPTTGIAYGGELLAKTTHVVAAIEKPLQAEVIGDASGEPKPVGAIVPLGERLPGSYACGGAAATTEPCRNASLGAFRLTMELPGGVADDLPGDEFGVILASDFASALGTRAYGDLPASTITVPMRRAVPAALAAELRNQEGYNRFVSPWIVAVADPRAREQFPWPAGAAKERDGCFQCERPEHLKNKSEADGVYELSTPGRFITVRLDPAIGSGIALLDPAKFTMRIPVVHAEAVRPPKVREAAQGAPVATGMLEGNILLHSGELVVSATDLVAGGRAGWNVAFGRTYRSRTIGGTVFGQGWDSPILRRLRVLATGDVELHDGTGEVWLFAMSGSAEYQSPAGFFVKLVRTDRGWNLIDQKWRITSFDEYGRLVSESDEFFDGTKPGSGNVIRSLYDDSGRLVRIVDPVGRVSTITYWADAEEGTTGAFPGYVKEITDWRNRRIRYEFNPKGQLIRVRLPQVTGVSESVITYEYAPTSAAYADVLELSNLWKITEPGESTPRITFEYETAGVNRDRVKRETWATGETATITYDSETSVSVTDVLGQRREYALTAASENELADRVHTATLVEKQVPTSTTPMGELPTTLNPAGPSTSSQDRTYSFSYRPEGMLETATHQGVRSVVSGWQPLLNGAGFVPKSVTTNPLALPSAKTLPASKTSQATNTSLGPITREFVYQTGPNAGSFLAVEKANGSPVEVMEPHRANRTPRARNSEITSEAQYDEKGQLKSAESSGGIDPEGAGSRSTIEYFDETAPLHARGLPKFAKNGELETRYEYPDPYTTIVTDPRGVVTTTKVNEWLLPVSVDVTKPGDPLTLHETSRYDSKGRLETHTRRQSEKTITTTNGYDAMDRLKSVASDNVAVEGSLTTITTTTAYDLAQRRIITTQPGGATTTTYLDASGRAERRVIDAGPSGVIEERYAYDVDDNPVYSGDMFTASASAWDAHGRQTASLAPDLTKQLVQHDAWGRTIQTESQSSTGEITGATTFNLTDGGKLRYAERAIDGARLIRTEHTWDGAGRIVGSGMKPVTSADAKTALAAYDSLPSALRASRRVSDESGRTISARQGGGTAGAISDEFTAQINAVASFTGTLPQQVTVTEKGGSFQSIRAYNLTGATTRQSVGNLTSETSYDEAGNETKRTSPGKPPTTYVYDGRGAAMAEQLPDSSVNRFDYGIVGAITGYTDPTSQATRVERDL
ncbi:MAG: Ig-like domain-containing protein, partial [Thermoanaerobaculia bacterium]